uniref:Uncharacterized protein n=1 Tax=Rhipicephalus zambeziensis TaxID=60191 RepID=A0A224YFG3_9ACAR
MNSVGIFLLVTSAAFAQALQRPYRGPYKSAQQQGLPGMEIPTLPPNVANPQGGLPGFGSSRPPIPSFSIPSRMPVTMPPLPFSPENFGNSNQRPSMPQWPSFPSFPNIGGSQQGGQMPQLPWSPASGNNGNSRWPGMQNLSQFFPLNMTQIRMNGLANFSWPPTPYWMRNIIRDRMSTPGLGDPPPSQNGQGSDNQRPNIFPSPRPFSRRTVGSSRTSIRTPPSIQLMDGNRDY